MHSVKSRFGAIVCAAVFAGTGCHSTPISNGCNDSCAPCEGRACEEPKRWSTEWYAQRADDPEGARQVQSHGKLWPPYPRPTGAPQEFTHRYHSTHYWPYPYNCQDRAYLRAVSDMQAGNGWMAETTLYNQHFEDDNQQLNHSGRLHLKWILETVPRKRRFVWVQAADDKAVSESRLAGVKSAGETMAGKDDLPPIALRVCTPPRSPTSKIYRSGILETESIPKPRIKYGSNSSGSGGGITGGSDGGI